MLAATHRIALRGPLRAATRSAVANPAVVRRCSSATEATSQEATLRATLARALDTEDVTVTDVSGGCGAMFSISVVSPLFEGKKLVEQHRMVKDTIKAEIGEMHGLTVQTKAPSKVGKA